MLTINRALGYDLNTVEFAIKDNIPYAIDFMNPAPDADLHSVGPFYHEWITEAVTKFILKRLGQPETEPHYRWDGMLNPPQPEAAKAKATKSSLGLDATPAKTRTVKKAVTKAEKPERKPAVKKGDRATASEA